MIKLFHANQFADTCSNIMVATLPFITVGMLGNPVVLYISTAVGGIFLIGFLYSLISRKCISATLSDKMAQIIRDLLSLPYAFALSSVILMSRGINADEGLWFALFLAIVDIVAGILPDKGK